MSVEVVLTRLGMLTDLDHAPLALNGLAMEHVFSSQADLITQITKHYSTSILAQSYLVICQLPYSLLSFSSFLCTPLLVSSKFILCSLSVGIVNLIFVQIIGSADFLGNPVSLISNLGTGVYDFFHEPIKGIVSSPKDFGMVRTVVHS